MTTLIPLRNLGEPVIEFGHVEVDCVAHCGGSLSGEFIWTVTMTDILTGWTECQAVVRKDAVAVRNALVELESRFPFDLRAIYSDNGSEFLNDFVFKEFTDARLRSVPLRLFRSRPYKKNDQCYVEQKNYTHVRKLFGYDRLEGAEAARAMNALYGGVWRLLQNHFDPQVKLVEKTRVGARQMRKFDKPRPPFDRVLMNKGVTPKEVDPLTAERRDLNPFLLRREAQGESRRVLSNQQARFRMEAEYKRRVS